MGKPTYNLNSLIRARLKKGWNQAELARRVGMNRSVISRLESGKTQNPATVERVARELRIAIRSLV